MQEPINGFEMYYEDSGGAGLPLLLIHGFPLNGRMWAPQVAHLRDRYRVIVPDLRGHGRSEAVHGPYLMDLLAQDLNALLDRLQVDEPVVVAGLSMGGYITFAFYRQFASRVRAVILAATRAGEDAQAGKENRAKTAQKAEEQGAAAVVADMLPKMMAPVTYERKPDLVAQAQDIMLETSREGVIGASLGMKERPDSKPTLEKMSVPGLILHGADDQLMPPGEAESMHAALAGSDLHILPEAGHLLNLEQADLFNQQVGRFLSGLERR